MINFDFDKKCFGCRNCENICPTKAIKLIENEEGFLMPVIDKKKCIQCGMCNKKCPFLNIEKNKEKNRLNKWYACYMKDKKKIKESSSGGIFPLLAECIMKKDGYISGCVWNNKLEAIHIVTNQQEKVNKMKGSKYVQSDLNKTVEEIKFILNEGKLVLFTGTPCQVATVKSYLPEKQNLYTMAVICEGVGSPKVWRRYKKYIERKNHSKLIDLKFRSKEIGWEPPVMKHFFSNGKIKSQLTFTTNIYGKGFLEGLYYRKSCNNCQYKFNNYNADIVVGDFWGVNKKLLKETNNKGVSVLLVNTLRGEKMFDEIKENIVFQPINFERVVEQNQMIIQSAKYHENRENFFKNIDNLNIKTNINKSIDISKKKKAKNVIKEFAYKTKTYNLIKNIIK